MGGGAVEDGLCEKKTLRRGRTKGITQLLWENSVVGSELSLNR